MSDTAFQTVYRQEMIAGFEFSRSLLSTCVTNQAMIQGNQAVFLVVDSGGAVATTRGVNGLITARVDNNTQLTATLVEWHDLVRKTGFNVFASQGDQRAVMQRTTMAVINRKMDLDIISMLDGATNDTGTAQTASVALVAKSLTILGNNYVPIDDAENLFGVVTPAFWAYLMQTNEFTNGQWVDVKAFNGTTRLMFRWFGVNWIVHPLLTGTASASEKCYLFHRSAVGHVVNSSGMQSPVGYDPEQDYSYARCSVYIGSKLLQNSGIVQMIHDGSAYVAT